MSSRIRAVALVLAVAPVFAACGGMVDNETIGTAATSTPHDNANVSFIRYSAIGTSLGAGIESGGILDSTQRETYTYRLAVAMGLTPGANWFYPSLAYPGCPAPYTNVLTGARLNGTNIATNPCFFRTSGSARPYESNVSIPSLRAYQALRVDSLNPNWATTDTLKLAQFLTGSVSPVTMVVQSGATFATVEVGANDVLGAATRGTPLLLTPPAEFDATIKAIADSMDAYGIAVAIANVPDVTSIPFFTRASTIWCLNTGACGIPATLPYSSPLFTIDLACRPNAAGGTGDNYLLSFNATGAVTNTLAASRAAKIDCTNDSVLVAVAGPPAVPTVSAGPSINPTELTQINAAVAAFNASISSVATARGYALVDLNATLAAIPSCTTPTTPAVCKPAIPFFTAPSQIFGPVFSYDGVHPNGAGYRLMAQTFAAAINTKFALSTPITVP